MAENTSNGADYQINFINNSTNAGNFMVFQQDPNLNGPDIASLAWITKFLHPNTNGSFNWKLGFDFVWMENKSLASGITSVTSQCIPADLVTNNTIMLTYDGAYNFTAQPPATTEGSLYITTDQTIPPKQVGVGIGMSGAPTFLVSAEPNFNLTFSPQPDYWIAFGEFEQGQVLNVKELTNSAQVVFPEGINTVNITLNADNTWTILPG